MHEEVSLTREVDAIQIPSGDTITLPTGTPVVITQTLGGTYTVATSAGLARISSNDADALGARGALGLEERARVRPPVRRSCNNTANAAGVSTYVRFDL